VEHRRAHLAAICPFLTPKSLEAPPSLRARSTGALLDLQIESDPGDSDVATDSVSVPAALAGSAVLSWFPNADGEQTGVRMPYLLGEARWSAQTDPPFNALGPSATSRGAGTANAGHLTLALTTESGVLDALLPHPPLSAAVIPPHCRVLAVKLYYLTHLPTL